LRYRVVFFILKEKQSLANPDNLIQQSTRSPKEAREMGRKGGIASGEARRKKTESTPGLTDAQGFTNE
jgi:hypothetical protein